MRIRSVSIHNYRVHRHLEVTFDEKLTVIGGPNESGKSTLVEAMHRALFMRFKSGGADLEAMQSQFGGHPEVALTFEVGDRTVRLRKTFKGPSGSAVLEEQGKPMLFGDAAEARLAELLREDAAARRWDRSSWSHLWVWQGKAFANPMDDTNVYANDIVSRFQASGAAVVQQSSLDAHLSGHFAAYADTFYTQTGAVRKNSRLEVATERHRAAQQLSAERRASLDKLFDADRRLENARAIQQEVAGSLVDREQELADAKARAHKLNELRNLALLQEKDADQAHAQLVELKKREADIRDLRQRVAMLTEQLAPMQQQAAQLALKEQAANAALQAAIEKLTTCDDAVRAAGIQLALAQAFLTRLELRQRLSDLEVHFARAMENKATISKLDATMAALPGIAAIQLEAIEHAARELDRAQATLSGIATRVELLHGGTTVVLGSTPLAPGSPLTIFAPTELVVGTDVNVRITPGGGASVAEAQQKADDTQRRLATLLQEAGVQTTAEARSVLDRRTALGQERTLYEQRLVEHDPEGLEADRGRLNADIAAAEADVVRRREQGAQLDEPRGIDEARRLVNSAEASLHALEDQRQAMLKARVAAYESVQSAEEEKQQHNATTVDQQRDLKVANGSLASKLDVYGNDIDRAHLLASAEAVYRTAADTVADTRSTIAKLDPDGVDEQCRMLYDAVGNLRERRASAQSDELVARKELEQDGSRDPHAELALAEAAEQQAAVHLARVRLQADAIRELRDLYASEQQRLAEQFEQPLRTQIDKYLRVVLPDSSMQLQYDGQAFDKVAIARGSQQSLLLPFDALSTGAREQVAMALRLGVAEVLAAAHDGTLPVVFDDAFAYSDADRLKLLRRMLFRAAESGLQVIVLSCNASDYDGLGKRIDLERPVDLAVSSPDEPAATGSGLEGRDEETDGDLPLPEPTDDSAVASADDIGRFLDVLRARGTSAGNQSLREQLGWTEGRYASVRNELVAAGRISIGRGRGGSVSLVEGN